MGDKTSASEDVIPEPAMRNSAGYDNFHTGVRQLNPSMRISLTFESAWG